MLPIAKYNKESNTLFIDVPERGLKVVMNGDLSLTLDGEISLVTRKENICIDTIGGKIFLNSRQGKDIKDLPESIEYRKNIKKEIEDQKIKHEHDLVKSCPFLDIITNMNEKIKDIEKRLESKCQE